MKKSKEEIKAELIRVAKIHGFPIPNNLNEHKKLVEYEKYLLRKIELTDKLIKEAKEV